MEINNPAIVSSDPFCSIWSLSHVTIFFGFLALNLFLLYLCLYWYRKVGTQLNGKTLIEAVAQLFGKKGLKKETSPERRPIENLVKYRTVILDGQINESKVGRVVHQLVDLQTRSRERINLIIESSGGNTQAALSLCNIITTLLTVPVRGIVLNECGSAATFILLHCHERVCAPHARFLVHSGSMGNISIPINEKSAGNLKQLIEEVRAAEERTTQLYMERLTPSTWATLRPSDEVRRAHVQKLIARGDQRFNSWITSKEAVEAGLIERIIEGNLGIFSA